MKPVETPDTNFTYKLAGGTEENDLPCVVTQPEAGLDGLKPGTTTSFWALEESDGLSAGAIHFLVQNPGIRTVWVGFGERIEGLELLEAQLAPLEGGGHGFVKLDEDRQQLLMLGGHFVLRVPGHPTPPVSVWLDPPEIELVEMSPEPAVPGMSDTVRLEGGPFDGETVQVKSARSPLLVEIPNNPDFVARYRPTRQPGVLRFRDYDRVVARLDPPGSQEVPNGS
jgi:hypothetical protein